MVTYNIIKGTSSNPWVYRATRFDNGEQHYFIVSEEVDAFLAARSANTEDRKRVLSDLENHECRWRSAIELPE